MDREFCIDYILDDCLDCPEREEDSECKTESHCFEVKEKIIADLRKLDKIEQIVEQYQFYKFDGFLKIKEVLENG